MRLGRSTLRPANGVGEKGIQLSQRLTPCRIRFLINEVGVREGLAIRYGREPKNTSASSQKASFAIREQRSLNTRQGRILKQTV